MPILDQGGSFLGAVEVSIPMDDTLGLAKSGLHGGDQKVVLAGRMDQRPAKKSGKSLDYMKHEYVILLHEAFEGERKQEMRKEIFPLDESLDPEKRRPRIDQMVPELDLRPMQPIEPDNDYTDPLGEDHSQKYGGPWLAGFGQVGNTELMVIVQQKYEDAVGRPTSLARKFVWWGCSSLALAFVLAGGVIWYRNRRAMDKERL
jgi:hypothetical protein